MQAASGSPVSLSPRPRPAALLQAIQSRDGLKLVETKQQTGVNVCSNQGGDMDFFKSLLDEFASEDALQPGGLSLGTPG